MAGWLFFDLVDFGLFHGADYQHYDDQQENSYDCWDQKNEILADLTNVSKRYCDVISAGVIVADWKV